MKVPFLDLKAQYAALRHEVDPAIAKVIENCAFVGSRQLVPFETAFAQFCEIPHAIGVSNGTDALKLALSRLDPKMLELPAFERGGPTPPRRRGRGR